MDNIKLNDNEDINNTQYNSENDFLPTSINNNDDKNQKNKKTLYLILFIILFLIIGLFTLKLWQLKNSTNNYWFDKLAKNGILEGRTPEEIQSILNQIVEEGMFNVSINPDPIFEYGSSEGNIAIENIPANHYYTRVSITLNETGETVFQSAGIKPGQYIDYIKLNKELPKGDYAANAYFEITDPETLTQIGGVNTQITIHVLN